VPPRSPVRARSRARSSRPVGDHRPAPAPQPPRRQVGWIELAVRAVLVYSLGRLHPACLGRVVLVDDRPVDASASRSSRLRPRRRLGAESEAPGRSRGRLSDRSAATATSTPALPHEREQPIRYRRGTRVRCQQIHADAVTGGLGIEAGLHESGVSEPLTDLPA
jgi:hypothetical protein